MSYTDEFQKGKSLFEEKKYSEAKEVFTAAGKLEGADEKKCNLWIRKCNTHVDDAAEAAAAKKKEEEPTAAAKPVAAVPVAVSHNVRFEWFQTATTITLTFFVKGRVKDDCDVKIDKRSLEVTIRLGEGHEYSHDVENFFADVDPSKADWVVKSMKLEITVPKAQQGIQWAVLEAPVDATTAQVLANPTIAAAPKTASDLPVPNSKGRDWSKFKLTEEEEKLEGDQAMNKFFKDIYKGASDEQRMSMMKSFQESNGTVLSTNPEEVMNKKVECQPPKGMDVKNWEQ